MMMKAAKNETERFLERHFDIYESPGSPQGSTLGLQTSH
jgi:hypothetical protein